MILISENEKVTNKPGLPKFKHQFLINYNTHITNDFSLKKIISLLNLPKRSSMLGEGICPLNVLSCPPVCIFFLKRF